MRRFCLLVAGLLALGVPARADLIKQGAAYTRTVLMTSASDHVTGVASLTLTVKLSKAGGAFATITPTVTDLGGGRYAVALTTAHTDTLGGLDLQITATNADPTDTHDQVVAFDPGDAAGLGLTRLDAAVSSRSSHTAADVWAVGTRSLTDKAGFSLAAAPPTVSQIAAGILATPANLLATNASGYVTATNGGGSGGLTAADIWGYTGTGGRTLTGNVTVGGYAAGQDPATLLLAATVDGTMTLRQAQALSQAILAGRYSITRPTSTSQVTTYYRADGTTPIATSTAITNSAGALTRTWAFSNLP